MVQRIPVSRVVGARFVAFGIIIQNFVIYLMHYKANKNIDKAGYSFSAFKKYARIWRRGGNWTLQKLRVCVIC